MLSVIDMNIVGNDFLYQRTSNFSVRRLEDRLIDYYGGFAKKLFLTGSGMEAVTSTIEYLLPKTGKILIDKNLYVETRLWLRLVERYDVVQTDMHDISSVRKCINGIDLVLLDNPNVFQQWFDAKEIARICHEAGAKLVVDNSIVSFYYYNPLTDGADIVVESYSKYISGHGDCMCGAIVFGYEPDNMARLDAFLGWRGRVVNPVTAYNLEKGLETLRVRMNRQETSAKYIINLLRKKGENILYCGHGGMFLDLGRTKKEAEKLKLFVVNLAYGFTYSMATPSYNPDLYTGYGNYVRFSCGLEDKKELLRDIRQAFCL